MQFGGMFNRFVKKTVKPLVKDAWSNFLEWAAEGEAKKAVTKEVKQQAKPTTAAQMPIGRDPNSIYLGKGNRFDHTRMKDAYDQAIATPADKRTLEQEKIISDYSTAQSRDQWETVFYGPGYQTNNPVEVAQGWAPRSQHSLTAVALDQNKPYKVAKDGTKSLNDGWYDSPNGPVFDLDRFISELKTNPNINYVDLTGNTEMNPSSTVLHNKAVLDLLRSGEWEAVPKTNKRGSWWMYQQNNWNANKEVPKGKRNATVDEKIRKQDQAMRLDSTLTRSLRLIPGLEGMPFPARINLGNTHDTWAFPGFSLRRKRVSK